MGHQNCIGAVTVEFACNFITDVDIFETSAAIKLQGFAQDIIPRFNYKTFVNLLFDFSTSYMCAFQHIINIQLREAKIKFPGVLGAFGAFWMVGSNFWKEYVDGGRPTNHGEIWPKCGEIDITETIPGNATQAKANIWSYTGASLGTGASGTINIADWNVYACERTDEYVAIFVNDVEYKRWTFSDYSASAVQAYQLPFYMILNLAVGASGGTPSESLTEMKMYVDWVRVYAPLS